MLSSRLAYLASIAAISAVSASTDAEVAPTGAAGFKLNASKSAWDLATVPSGNSTGVNNGSPVSVPASVVVSPALISASSVVLGLSPDTGEANLERIAPTPPGITDIA